MRTAKVDSLKELQLFDVWETFNINFNVKCAESHLELVTIDEDGQETVHEMEISKDKLINLFTCTIPYANKQ